ncbi:SDR family oxidoreductase [Emticicia sp. 17c]|uniref:SDR family oxidoreductase n=1 Tax=Emticicia sp. 17c TaxID=3127704 RepID=UPI00301DF7EB
MILITGATGHLGTATIDFLLQKGTPASNIAALVRDEAKAGDLKAKGVSIVTGDYDNYASLTAAFKGIDKLFFVSGNDIAKRSQQHEKVVNAAKEAGVKHILYTSFVRKNETETSPIAQLAKSHIDTEKYLKASGLPYTILRNNIYAEYIPVFIGQQVLETGIFLPAGDTQVAFTLRSDMAEAFANILTSEGHENQDYLISNTSSVSFHDIAAIISEASGKEVGYVSPSTEAFVDTLTKAGVPAEVIGISVGFAGAFKEGEFASTDTDLEKLLGRKPTSVRQYLTKLFAA